MKEKHERKKHERKKHEKALDEVKGSCAALDISAFARGNVLSDKCPSRHLLKHVTSRWAVLIFFVLNDGQRYRFSEIRRTIEGVSEKMLAQTLQTLERDNFVCRIAYPVVPPKVEYHLTPIGLQAAEHVITLVDWLECNVGEILSPENTYSDS